MKKIKITKCSKHTLWYANYIGEIFEVWFVKDIPFVNLPIEIFNKHIGFGHRVKKGDYEIID